jgi:large conductance mechanosensitive channel
MLKEFKEFALKGSMLDMAIGIIIGAAFGTVVKSLVDDVIMPLVSSVLNAPDFTNLFVVLKDPQNIAEVNMNSIVSIREAGGIAFGYGLFINALIAFLIVAFVLFLIVKSVNRMKRKEEEKAVPEAAPGLTQEELLTEIRDLLKAK